MSIYNNTKTAAQVAVATMFALGTGIEMGGPGYKPDPLAAKAQPRPSDHNFKSKSERKIYTRILISTQSREQAWAAVLASRNI